MKREAERGEDEEVKFVALGGGSEVGRSCHIVSYKGKTIMLDAGVHPAFTGMSSLPFYDEYDLSKVDVLLISHFHLDHAASLPYVMQHTEFEGRVFMTHPTKAIYRWLLSDFVKVSGSGDNDDLYTDEDLSSSFDKIEAIDFYSTHDIDGIKFTAYHAGHVLGAAMYLIEISGVKILFTGDYSREEDRHLHIAEVPPDKPDVLICESTYGTGIHQPRLEKERRLMNLIHTTVSSGGRCLLPVFALGTAQELMLILDEYWDKHPELGSVNIYYASSLARKCMAVYQTFVNMMNDRLRQKFAESKSNPFQLKHIQSIRNLSRFDDIGPCVMLASPGMLQNGVSRELLERWAPDPKNSLIITGYSVEGTMAKHIMTEPVDIPSTENPDSRIPRRINVEEISFAAHVDFKKNSEFIDLTGAQYVILVHGETTNMGRLKSALLSKYSKMKGTHAERKIFNPRNCTEIALPFKTQKVAKTVGSLAGHHPEDGDYISGVLVQKDFKLSLVSEADIKEYTGLSPSIIMQKQTVTVDAGPDLVRYHLTNLFGDIEEVEPNAAWKIMNVLEVRRTAQNQYSVEWETSPTNDTFADSALALLLSVDSSKASVKLSTKTHDHEHRQEDDQKEQTANYNTDNVKSEYEPHLTERDSIVQLLKPHFGDGMQVDTDSNVVQISVEGGQTAEIDLETFGVKASIPALEQRVSHILKLCRDIVTPLYVITPDTIVKQETTTAVKVEGN